MINKPLTIISLLLTCLIGLLGLKDPQSLVTFASSTIDTLFESRGWFIMLSVTVFVFVCIGLALSPYGNLKLGHGDDQPEFSTPSWLAMLFSAGMGVGLLYWGSAEPLSHFDFSRTIFDTTQEAATAALFITNFHWGIHAWSIYAILGLVIAYFSYRRNTPILISAPIQLVFGHHSWSKAAAPIFDLMALSSVAIGVAGSIAMGIFQIRDGVAYQLNLGDTGVGFTLLIFLILFVSYMFPLMLDLSKGMSLISNICILITAALAGYILITGPTHYMMNAILDSLGGYAERVLTYGLRTYTFADAEARTWFKSWTLTYMIWWIAWAPFVSVFIARISRGRTIREFIVMVIGVPTLVSILWFGIFGSVAFHQILSQGSALLQILENKINIITFMILSAFPLKAITIPITILVSFLFVVTSVVSAAFVLAMFSEFGDQNPSIKSKLMWGIIVGVLGIVMILTDSIEAVRSIIALGAMPSVFILLILLVCLLKDLTGKWRQSHG